VSTPVIKILPATEIDFQKWDTVVSESVNPSVFAYSWYMQPLTRGKWYGLIYGDYEAVMPLNIVRRAGVKYLAQPVFSRDLALQQQEGLNCENDVFSFLAAQFRLVNIGFPGTQIPDNGFEGAASVYQQLKLSEEYSLQAQRYSTNAVRMLKKFDKEQGVIGVPESSEVIVDLFRHEKGNEFSNLKSSHYMVLLHLMKHIEGQGRARMIEARIDGELAAAAFFVITHHTILFLKGAATVTGKKAGAVYAIFDAVIREFSETDVTLDFGGSRNEGLAAFNKKFGAQDKNYLILTRNNTAWPVNALVRKKWKK
jgi:hypothetical protein